MGLSWSGVERRGCWRTGAPGSEGESRHCMTIYIYPRSMKVESDVYRCGFRFNGFGDRVNGPEAADLVAWSK
jgi:hypothetical protein